MRNCSGRIDPLVTNVSPRAPSVPPLTMSRPSGVSPMRLAFQLIVSSSAPPSIVSFPVPPFRVSLPSPPFRASAPALPFAYRSRPSVQRVGEVAAGAGITFLAALPVPVKPALATLVRFSTPSLSV